MITGSTDFLILEDYEFLEFFESEAVDSSIENGYWCYEYSDKNNITLKFSFNIFEKSIQTQIWFSANCVESICYEGNCKMKIEKDTLICDFIAKDRHTVLKIKLKDHIEVNWSSIRV